METCVIYLRLSRDDGQNAAESESIQSQRLFLTQFARKNSFSITAEFVDDGISGMIWERPALQNMIKAAESGWIRTILVKDLSRISRDYIRVGEMLEKSFPRYGIRFIAVNDGIDTGKQLQTNDFSPIRAIMNDWYARDISVKVRSAIYARQGAGYCRAAHLPDGYQRIGGEICIRDDRASVIRMIFSHYRESRSCCQTAKYLNHLAIPSSGGGVWSDAAVYRILKNTAYTGKLMLHTTQIQSYKSSRRIRTPETDRICCRIPAVISDAEFDAVQSILQKNAHHMTEKHWLTGKAVCRVCGRMMYVSAQSGRLICAGRKNGNGCRNPSQNLTQLISALSALKILGNMQNHEDYLPYLVDKIEIDYDEITVQLRCRQPAAHNL